MIALIITVCAIALPAQCQDEHLPMASGASPRQCAMSAPPYIAKWVDEHPQWRVVRWHCEIPHSNDKA
ncbi:hypothetical protein SLNSH_09005 [Alsobacter soli]|uniref:Uncharacterized protein n=1 Tax=Alsobacter soli TaxID=2109933 RepID=A0A2T1HUL4_9HYPH|nr:hypothetical protein [Alsobacter soli]PSC05331.1 hypothetical protein SLNSH_09005 [Alsobacter soli]